MPGHRSLPPTGPRRRGGIAGPLLLAGCADPDTATHYQQVQCEDNPWGAGADADAIEDHYGVDVVAARGVDDGRGYAAVCGGPSSTHVQVEVAGDASALTQDGWRAGPVPTED